MHLVLGWVLCALSLQEILTSEVVNAISQSNKKVCGMSGLVVNKLPF